MVAREVLPEGISVIDLSYFNPKHRGNKFRCMHMIDGADDDIANKIV